MKNNLNPVATYENPEIQKDTISSENKGWSSLLWKAGIYRWTNLLNGKSYIGSGVDLRVRLRYYFNINELKRNNNMLICRALLKHGHINFSLEILEYCQPSQVLPIEDKYFKLLKPSYNILKNAGGEAHSLGYKHSEESRGPAKMSAWQVSAPKSEEDKAKISASMMGNNNGKNSSGFATKNRSYLGIRIRY